MKYSFTPIPLTRVFKVCYEKDGRFYSANLSAVQIEKPEKFVGLEGSRVAEYKINSITYPFSEKFGALFVCNSFDSAALLWKYYSGDNRVSMAIIEGLASNVRQYNDNDPAFDCLDVLDDLKPYTFLCDWFIPLSVLGNI